MKKLSGLLLSAQLAASALMPAVLPVAAAENDPLPKPDLPADLQEEYTYYAPLSDEFNGTTEGFWLMDYMPWWSDTAKREKSGTKTRYRFINADTENNQSIQIYVNGENDMDAENFQPYYLEKLSGPTSASVKERYLWSNSKQKNSWNSKFAGFMGGAKTI